jgi:UDP-N-acetylglucosamine 2-epimerase (non-hydrolysing)
MKAITAVGARPNFMKAASIVAAIREHHQRAKAGAAYSDEPIQNLLIHTGQHYDKMMSDSFFADLNLPQPDVYLGVGSASHAVQTGEIMRQFEQVLLRERPEVVVVVGDVNSTLACALVTSKISFGGTRPRPLIAHVEAGLRSFDRTMPEEINRILTDHLSDLLFVSEESGIQNLHREGIGEDKIHFVGNTMIDALLAFQEKAATSKILDNLGLRKPENGSRVPASTVPYSLLTLHRPSNVDDRETFLNILSGLVEVTESYPMVFPAHPRTQQRLKEFGLQQYFPFLRGVIPGDVPRGLMLIDPQGYLDFLCLMKNAALVVTDSGGVQEETTCLGVPCVTVRENTERPVTVEKGTNVLSGVQQRGIREAVRQQFGRKFLKCAPAKWDGQAGRRIVDALLEAVQTTSEIQRLSVA